MDISGPVRTLLRNLASHKADSPLEMLAHRVAFPEETIAETPAFLKESAAPILPGQFSRTAHGWLTLSAALRVVSRIGRWVRAEAVTTLRPQFEAVQNTAEQLLLARNTAAADFLWHHWLLVLAQRRMDMSVSETLLTGLWRRGWSATSRRTEPAPLHVVGADGSLETSVYHDLLAIHAAYNSVVLLQEHERLDPIEKLVRWHVHNTQPDNTTTEPWGLAAFACLDETQTFASQQVHDAATHLQSQRSQVTLSLLADALLTQEETSG